MNKSLFHLPKIIAPITYSNNFIRPVKKAGKTNTAKAYKKRIYFNCRNNCQE